jgi:NAD/NADP transhydrogenase alpha subunit
MITIAGTAERHGESRVALSPEAAKKLTALGCLVKVETGLYAKNLLAYLELMIDKKDKTLKVNWDDEIVKGTLVAEDGKIVHPMQHTGA